MNVDVGNNCQVACTADRPQLAEMLAVKADDSGVEAMGIEIVVVDNVRGLPELLEAEQKRAALTCFVSAAVAQPCDQAGPEQPGA
jgi:hypothetical protein